ncbi:MAG TPA: Flp pilus assembly protein CpaB [Anaerolineaceae bacterium]|nr:Flp pilus assembly protein CpaB [Anaerolineaceae bacterium]HOU45149.1 Flp pilus assembly protein CpaB [Anaerolineaceae bacterium]HQF46611.1 Flp pilus assembly protein CpaB [Anaerolineaceae bacterium]HQH36512.1 Flp pilus assembly protein CpaB [Anaerolineaceae bacterium]
MNNRLRGILLLIIGFVLIAAGIVAVYFLTRQSGLLGSVVPQPTPGAQLVVDKAVIVTHDMRLGDVIKEEDVTTSDIPTEFLPRDFVSDPADVIGKYLKADLIQGEMVLQHNVADPTNRNGDLAFILSDDHILMAISVDDVMTRESIISRGDIVDVYVTMTETVNVESIPGVGGETSPIPDDTGETTEQNVPRSFTFDAFQNLGITALVADVITQTNQGTAVQRIEGAVDPSFAAEDLIVRAYLLALNPQDALVLKHLKDNGAVFDLMLRSPTSTRTFDLIPVTQEYIVELYGLEILK